MNLIGSLNSFYSNLSSDGMFFFWMLVFLFVFLIFLSITLLIKNNKLTKIILKQKENEQSVSTDKKTIEEEKKTNDVDSLVDVGLINQSNIIKQSSFSDVSSISSINEDEEVKKNIVENNLQGEKEEQKERKLYQKNVLREINAKMPTSPICIERKKDSDTESFMDMASREDSSVSPLLEMEDNYSPNVGMVYLEEVSKKIEEEAKPSNIELTEFEKKQEEEAIISYNELLKVKDKIYNITEDEETDEFIDELKSLRFDLQ